MAKKLKTLPVSLSRCKGPLYPWNEWLDGSPWELVKGKDFHCSLSGFMASAYHAAQRRGMYVKTRTNKTDVVCIQAFTDS